MIIMHPGGHTRHPVARMPLSCVVPPRTTAKEAEKKKEPMGGGKAYAPYSPMIRCCSSRVRTAPSALVKMSAS